MSSPTDQVKQIIYTYPDLEFAVVAEPHDYHVNYSIVEQTATKLDGTTALYNQKGLDGVLTENPLAAVDYIVGSVKWDGCSNWDFDPNDERVMLHGCSRSDLERIGQILAICWDLTATLCPNWAD